ncbi:hypothetical protein ACNKHS_05300 [Shigella flexneri]
MLNPHSQPVEDFILCRIRHGIPDVRPIASVDGTINLPQVPRAFTNRALLLAALARQTVLTNLLDSDDVRHMLNALSSVRGRLSLSADRTRCEIIGNGGPLHAEGALELFLGNARRRGNASAGRTSCLGSDSMC